MRRLRTDATRSYGLSAGRRDTGGRFRCGGLVRLFATVCVVLAVLVSPSAAATPAARAYLDHALGLMRTNAVYTPHQGWKVIIETAHFYDASARTPSDEYEQIRSALGLLYEAGDKHVWFLDPKTAKARGPGGTAWTSPSPPPKVSLLKGRYGLVSLTGIMSLSATANARRYSATALTAIDRLQRTRHPCGWVIDLRSDTRGIIPPMLLSVGPILGSGRVLGFSDKKGDRSYHTYRDSTIFSHGALAYPPVVAPVKVADFKPAPAVAVLTDPNTASAGEAVLIAFRGRPQTRSFGATTYGATTAPYYYPLSDGAAMQFATHWFLDRHGTAYKQAIPPDVPTKSPVPTAQRWLATTPSCS